MTLLIKNARLETGFLFENNLVIGTNTDCFDLLIEEGKIVAIDETISSVDAETIDVQGQLLLPSFREMHIHIDKTYFSGEWIAPTPITQGIFTRIQEEIELLPLQLPVAKERATKMVEHLIANGHTHIRSHCNVDPQIGTEHIKITKEVLESFADQITYEIVAFPQHGLLRSNVENLMREAMELGATHVGGVDPAIVDRETRRSLELIVEIAKTYDKQIDIHLHDRDLLGSLEIQTLMDIIEETGFTNGVTISHAIALSDLTEAQLEPLVKRMASFNIDVTSTIPIGQNRSTIPVNYLHDNGVNVSIGHDSLTDHWSPFGSGDTIEKLNTLAERFKYIDERSLGQAWKYAAAGITPLDVDGNQVWPKVGDNANFLVIDGVSSAHVVARRCPITTVISKGKVIHQNPTELKGALR
ncbi:amidohydrolase [Lysinibacillus sp. SGAir0095]|uniref:amidohydrolase n=1 Tax=Lysinibacillus sp. SGAir0095 TaxID=2070463 RepID=UPI0010CCC351|nr:amidohydrolase [Lysinibacillus sp. SGAir0095]QCR33557.1 deaminase [Lysinibacillus sp. SGAir0095]